MNPRFSNSKLHESSYMEDQTQSKTSSRVKLKFLRKTKQAGKPPLPSRETSAKKLSRMLNDSKIKKSPARKSKKSSLNNSGISQKSQKSTISRSKKRNTKSASKLRKDNSLMQSQNVISINEFQKQRVNSRSIAKRYFAG